MAYEDRAGKSVEDDVEFASLPPDEQKAINTHLANAVKVVKNASQQTKN